MGLQMLNFRQYLKVINGEWLKEWNEMAISYGLTEFMNEDVTLTYIENVVNKLKRGIYPTSNLDRLKTIIIRHNRIKEMKKNLKSRG